MISQWWSFGIAAGAALAQWIVGNRWWWGWLVALAMQPVWFVYGLALEQYGLLAHAALFTLVYVRNLRIWWRDRGRAEEQLPMYPTAWYSPAPVLPAWVQANTDPQPLVQTSSPS